MIAELKEKVLDGESITREEAVSLIHAPLGELCTSANEIRQKFCGNIFDMCTIINGKSGCCSENCKYCAQSSKSKARHDEYPLLDTKDIVEHALYNYKQGVLRFSIVCSGKKLSNSEVDRLCESIREIKKACPISVCVSAGLLDENNFRKLKDAGVTRVHNNLETSRRFFPKICTTHTFDDKLKTIIAAKNAGLEVCSGGIMGIGETMDDRIDLALTLRELGIKSIPVNILNPIIGMPLESYKIMTDIEAARIIAIFRFINPTAQIRLAGGRGLLSDMGKTLLLSGANAVISGDMLTTSGVSVENDMKTTKELGFVVKLSDKENVSVTV